MEQMHIEEYQYEGEVLFVYYEDVPTFFGNYIYYYRLGRFDLAGYLLQASRIYLN